MDHGAHCTYVCSAKYCLSSSLSLDLMGPTKLSALSDLSVGMRLATQIWRHVWRHW